MKSSILIFLLTSFMLVSQSKANASESEKLYGFDLCKAQLMFKDKPIVKSQLVDLPKSRKIHMSQALAKFTLKGKTIATNALCQRIENNKYTGSKEEWAEYIKRALDAIIKTGGKDIRLSLAAGKDKVFNGENSHKEFMISFDLDGNVQHVYTLALLDEELTTMYSISISGNKLVTERIKMEFSDLISTFKLSE